VRVEGAKISRAKGYMCRLTSAATDGGVAAQELPEDQCYRLPADAAAAVAFTPADSSPEPRSHQTNAAPSVRTTSPARFSLCRWIAEEANEPTRLLQLLEQKAKAGARPSADYAQPRTELEQKLCQTWEELLRLEKVGVNDDFFALGGHSLLAVRLFANVEKLLGVALPIVTIFQAPTVAQLAKVISAQSGRTSSRLVPIQPNGSRPPLFLIHGAGGDILWGYANLARQLNPAQPIYGIQARTADGVKDFGTLEEMAAAYLSEVRAFQPKGPYYLGGYCFGGNVAYEMARQLRDQGDEAALVALLDCAPSNTGYEEVQWWRPSFPFKFARNFSYWCDDFFKLKPQERRNLIQRKLGTLRRKFARRWRGSHDDDAVDLDEVIDVRQFPSEELKLWQAHLQLLVRHVSQPYDGDVVLFRTRGHPLFSSFEWDFGWGRLARGVAVKFVPGSHENIFMEPNVASLARVLEPCLGADASTVTREGNHL
jgi:thioesterase domain-containing protein/acyl carrier protein